MFKKYAKKMSLLDFAIWDFDQLSRFLDGNEEIRRCYAAWITPGDVLSVAFEWFQASRPEFGEVLANFLAKEFAAEQFARLTEAGRAEDERIPLASVFIDLPVSKDRVVDPPKEDSEQLDVGFAGHIIEIAKDRFAPRRSQTIRLHRALIGHVRPSPMPVALFLSVARVRARLQFRSLSVSCSGLHFCETGTRALSPPLCVMACPSSLPRVRAMILRCPRFAGSLCEWR